MATLQQYWCCRPGYDSHGCNLEHAGMDCRTMIQREPVEHRSTLDEQTRCIDHKIKFHCRVLFRVSRRCRLHRQTLKSHVASLSELLCFLDCCCAGSACSLFSSFDFLDF